MARQKTIITCAITGAIHTPTMSDALPWTYDDIAAQAIEAAEAGASILHLHARNPENGAPSVEPGRFHALPAADQAGDGCGGEHLHRRLADAVDPGADQTGRDLLAPRCAR